MKTALSTMQLNFNLCDLEKNVYNTLKASLFSLLFVSANHLWGNRTAK